MINQILASNSLGDKTQNKTSQTWTHYRLTFPANHLNIFLMSLLFCTEATTNQLPGMTFELPATTSQLAATTSNVPAIASQLLTTTSQSPTTTSQLPTTTSQLPTTSQLTGRFQGCSGLWGITISQPTTTMQQLTTTCPLTGITIYHIFNTVTSVVYLCSCCENH